jgi:hypothetical protein
MSWYSRRIPFMCPDVEGSELRSRVAVGGSDEISFSARPMGALGPRTPSSHDATRTHDTAINEVRQAPRSLCAACKTILLDAASAVRRGRVYGLVSQTCAVPPRWGTCPNEASAAVTA